MKKSIPAAVIVVLLIALWAWASPYWTLFAISSAIINNDPPALGEKVDFPALRVHLKDQLRAAIPKPSHEQDSLSAFGRAIGSRMGEWMIDAVVKPDTVIVFAREALSHARNQEELKSPWRRALAIVYRGRSRYEDFSTFSYLLPVEGGEIRFELDRSGLGWRLTNAVIPPETLKESIQGATGRKIP